MLAQGALDGADHVGHRHLGGVLGQPVAAAGATLGPDQARALEVEKDVLEELERYVLRLRRAWSP